DGIERWIFRGRATGVAGLNAVVSWPPEEWGYDPARMAEIRPGAHDIHERVRDMNRNGILASMCFRASPATTAPTCPAPRTSSQPWCSKAYNDWHIEEWAGAYPGRFLPLALMPTWDTELMIEDIDRVAANGFTAVT